MGAFTPAANDLLIGVAALAGTSTEPPVATSSTGNAGTWTLLDTITFTTAGNNGRIYAWAYDSAATATSTVVTFKTNAADGATACQAWVWRVAGMSKYGAAAKLQACEDNSHAAGTAAATGFGSAVNTNNPTLLFYHDEGTATGLTVPTSWTEPSSPASEGVSGGTPNSRGDSANRDSGFTGTTITWGTASTGVYGHYGIELDTSAAATTQVIPVIVVAT